MRLNINALIVAFAASFLIVAVLSSGVFRRFNSMVTGYDALHRSQDALERLETLEGAVKDVDRYETGLLLTHDSLYYRPRLRQAVNEILPASQALRRFTAGEPQQQAALTWARTALSERLYYLQQNLRAAERDTAYTIPNPAFLTGRRRSEEAVAHLNRLQSLATAVRNRYAIDRRLQQKGTSSSVLVLLVTFSILILLLFGGIVRELLRRLQAQRQSDLRLRELEQSHSELEQIAHAASHDLQEPLRKMQILTTKLEGLPASTDAQTTDILRRVATAASRLQGMVSDLVHFTELSGVQSTAMTQVPLIDAADTAMARLAGEVRAAGAVITCEPLPEVQGYPRQLPVLFEALLSNALKFAHPSRPPEIIIEAQTVEGGELASQHPAAATQRFNRITVRDNGIGFDNQYADKIFRLFQRLHNGQEGYDGQGLGLALAQRIMANHQGYITAHGHPQAGATFKLFFPVLTSNGK